MALTPEQIEARRHGIGGSDVAAILGMSPWRTPLDVYLEKTGQVDPHVNDGPDTPIYWGNVLEDLVASEYAKRTGHKIRRVNRHMKHKQVPIAMANIDRLVVSHPDGPGVLECKTARHADENWGETGTDEVPDYYLTQVVHYLAVTGYGWADLAVFFLADRDFRVYHIERDEDLITHLLETEQNWWRDHVDARVPPAPMTAEDMQHMWPRDNGASVVASPEVEAACSELAEVRAQIKALDARKNDLETSIKEAIGEASVLIDPAGRTLATWKASKPAKIINWGGVVAELGHVVGQDRLDDAISRNTGVRPGSRRFYLKAKKEG